MSPGPLASKILRLAWHLEYADFELLHPRNRSAGDLRFPLTNSDHRFVGGSHGFLALPEGHTLQFAALPDTEGYEPNPLWPSNWLSRGKTCSWTWRVASSILSGGASNVVTRACMLLLPLSPKRAIA